MIALIYMALGNPFSGFGPSETYLTAFVTVLFTLFSEPIAEEVG